MQAEWAATPPRERGEILRSVFETITARAEDFATLMTLEMGKVLAESMGEVKYGAEFFRWFAEEAVRIDGRYTPSSGGHRPHHRHQAARRAVLRDHPVELPAGHGHPQDRAGDGRGLHDDRQAGAGDAADDAAAGQADGRGRPAQGCAVGAADHQARRRHHGADRRRPAAQADVHRLDRRRQGAGQAERRTSCCGMSMELGGNAPFVVFDDADVDAAVDGAMLAKMRNGGEACTAANRFHVANAVREEFTEKLVKRMSEFTLGNGLDASSTLGPLINAKQVATVEELVDDAVSKGATVAVGGVAPGGPGNFYPATVLDRRARRRPHPQGGGVRARRADHRLRHRGGGRRRRQRHRVRAGRLHLHPSRWTGRCGWPRRIESGMVGVNRGVISDPAAPFGGVKESGFGREGGIEGIEEYLETKYIALT